MEPIPSWSISAKARPQAICRRGFSRRLLCLRAPSAPERRGGRAVCQLVCAAGSCGDRHESPGKTISFDPNLRPVLWKSEAEMVEKLNRLAFQADWVLPGLKEGMILTGESTPEGIADFYLNNGVKAVVLKTGCRWRLV
jgi:hypothetical protein